SEYRCLPGRGEALPRDRCALQRGSVPDCAETRIVPGLPARGCAPPPAPDRRIVFSQVSLFAVLADHDFQLAGLVDNGCAPHDRSGATRFVKRWRTEVWHSGYRIARAGDPI